MEIPNLILPLTSNLGQSFKLQEKILGSSNIRYLNLNRVSAELAPSLSSISSASGSLITPYCSLYECSETLSSSWMGERHPPNSNSRYKWCEKKNVFHSLLSYVLININIYYCHLNYDYRGI